jgi:hypothetical protein
MKDANRNDQSQAAQQSYPKENPRNRGEEKRPGQMNIPVGGGIPGQVTTKGSDIAQEDDLLQSDLDEEVANEVDSALDEAKARGEIREMPAMAEIERKHERKP